ncbi:MAG: plastocyanin/azurin family copper-binding protein [Bacteroidia bacterium]
MAHTVEIKDMKFQPQELWLNSGDTVVFINRDMVAHDVTEKNKAWASPPLLTGQSWRKVITESTDYYCSIHTVMKGKLSVRVQ